MKLYQRDRDMRDRERKGIQATFRFPVPVVPKAWVIPALYIVM